MSRIKDLFAKVHGDDDLTIDDELGLAHLAYLIEKETVINKLEMLTQVLDNPVYEEVIKETIDFIKKGEV